MEADAYADSSFLVSLFRVDGNHAEAKRYIDANQLTLAFTPLHRVEVRNALRNVHAFSQITAEELRSALRQIEDDLKNGFLIPIPADWGGMCRRADELSEKYAAKEGQRTIDLLHVALAVECGAKVFLTFDARQRKLAKAVGLAVGPR